MNLMKPAVRVLFFLISVSIFGQNDSIWMQNNDVLVGELKSLSKSVISYKTSYSEKDFQIDFNEVSRFSTQNVFMIYLTDNSHYKGTIKSTGPGKLQIWYADTLVRELDIQEIVLMSVVNQKFWKRFSGALDIGFNLSKANDNVQLTTAGSLKYASDKYLSKFSFNTLIADQDNVERIERREFAFMNLRHVKNYFVSVNINYLSSSELGIKNRINPGLGAGRTLITTEKLYWMAGLGINYNVEKYFDDTLDKESVEAKIATQFEMFNFSDLSVFTNVAYYASLSEKERFRLDYKLTFKYDLPFNFYIKTEFNLNYDNQPPENASSSDYALSTGFGWSL